MCGMESKHPINLIRSYPLQNSICGIMCSFHRHRDPDFGFDALGSRFETQVVLQNAEKKKRHVDNNISLVPVGTYQVYYHSSQVPRATLFSRNYQQ
jgi:hypothetical protein